MKFQTRAPRTAVARSVSAAPLPVPPPPPAPRAPDTARPPLQPRLDVRAIYQQHAELVWLTLQRMGVRPADLEDVAHDVFMIVHRRLGTFDGTSKLSTWLFGICMRVAANYRRRRRFTLEILTAALPDERPASNVAADDILVRREERELAEAALSRLDVAKRATFVMFEIESLSCDEISEMMGVPIGTVYSRLHAARKQLAKYLAKHRRQSPAPRA
jgi:RNA polymerase sigma-70 factor (ECF subfamily)